jgi:general secretion pathway protein D
MVRKSVLMGERRQAASMRNYRAQGALVVLTFFAGIWAPDVAAQAPEAAPARVAADTSSATRRTPEAPTAISQELTEALNRRGDLNLHGLSLNSALFTISEQWGVNIVAPELQGSVNGVFKQAPLREILDAILLSNGYNYQAVGQSLVVRSVADLGQSSPSLQSATIPVRAADIDEVVEGARVLLTPQGKVQALKSAGSIVVLDFPHQVQLVRNFVRSLEGETEGQFASPEGRVGRPLEVGYFKMQHITAKAAEQALAAVLSKSGRVGVLEEEDRLVISDHAENLAMIEKVLARIDYPRPQVRITALIYDISLADIEQLGINWNQVGKTRINADGEAETSLGIDSIMQVPFQANTAGSTLTFMNLSRHLDITAVALALSNASDARLMGNPNVAVIENEEAIFQAVEEIPYQQLTQTSGGGQIGTTAFKEAGTTLRVRPKISADGTIEMQVMPEFSRLAGFTPGDNQPIIDRRTASTVLRVCNRQTVVIGGLRQRSDVGDFKGVPYLKDIPGLGRAFRSRDTDVRESELVVFIMPEVIAYDDPPGMREQRVADTMNCRLDQIPLAEGCPPNCRRLPYDETMVGPMVETCGEAGEGSGFGVQGSGSTMIMQPGAHPVRPTTAIQLQYDVAGSTATATQRIAERSVRRLPVVVAAPAMTPSGAPAAGLFAAPPAAGASQPTLNARRPVAGVVSPR